MKKNIALLFPLILTTSLLVGCGGSDEDSTETTDTATDSTSAPALIINEIVADADDNGNDWIELYAINGSVDLADYTIVDDNADRTPQALPSLTLTEGDFIVIQAIDEEDIPPESGYYVTFKLGSDDAVTLYKNGDESSKLDWAEGDALQGYSYGLFEDGSGSAQTLSPTPGTINELTTDGSSEETTDDSDTVVNEEASLRINEVVAKAQDDGLDWIELYVTGESDINLSDYTLTDENGVLTSLPDVTLASGDFYRIYASNDTVENSNSVTFSLGANDEVRLFLGDDLIDHLSWNKGQALIGYSYGRYPDGSDATQTLTPSALATNIAITPGLLVINEVVANDADDGADWFELFNSSENNIALTDYQVIDESDDIEPVSLPDITLAPGQYVVIYAVDEDAEGTNDYYVPFKLGNSDELSLILNDETVDYLDWDDSDVISGYSYGLTNNENDSRDKDTLTSKQMSLMPK